MFPDYLANTARVNLKYAKGLVVDLEDEQFCEQPGSIVNHPAWILAHMCSANETGLSLLAREPVMPEELAARYRRGSEPTAERSDYPSKEELLSYFERQTESLIAGVRELDPAQLQEPMTIERLKERFPHIGDGVVYLLTAHPAIHLGQLSAWRRAMGMGPIN
ncbi:DinB superfamily protein [Planctomycetes bacterium Pan216]|uniref:DinB superfamily protein n=1 Tax=Kolteria novifilia TaxID=2527975 RepID=A0A518B4E2_9BACT|nr:DinB superfamily protein [Planctomycetes bacterium Pan216]